MQRDKNRLSTDSQCSEEDASRVLQVIHQFDSKILKKGQVAEMLVKAPAVITRLIEVNNAAGDALLCKILVNVETEKAQLREVVTQLLDAGRDDILARVMQERKLKHETTVITTLVLCAKWRLLHQIYQEELVGVLLELDGQFGHHYLNDIHGTVQYHRLVGAGSKQAPEHSCGVVHFVLAQCDVEGLEGLMHLGMRLCVNDDAGVSAFRFLIELARTGFNGKQPDDFLPLFEFFVQPKIAAPQRDVSGDLFRLRERHAQMTAEMSDKLEAIKNRLEGADLDEGGSLAL